MNNAIQIPNFVTVRGGPGEAPIISLKSRSGYQAEVSAYGAHLLHWRTPKNEELLFLSNCADLSGNKAIRGGVPIVFPQFSSQGPLPAHGFVRTAVWHIEKSSSEDNGEKVSVAFSLHNNAKTEALWPHQFELKLTIELSKRLTQTWTVINTGSSSFSFHQLFHSYFAVSDITHTAIRGLSGCEYLNQLTKSVAVNDATEIYIDSEIDNIFKDVPPELSVFDYKTNRGIKIECRNLKDAVVWNPWIEKSKKMTDLGPTDFKQFVCLETGNVTKPITLEAGQSFEVMQRFEEIS